MNTVSNCGYRLAVFLGYRETEPPFANRVGFWGGIPRTNLVRRAALGRATSRARDATNGGSAA